MSLKAARPILTAVILLLAVVSGGNGRVEGIGKNRRFISDRYSFSMICPDRWLVSAIDDTPIYFSFAPSEAGDFNHQLKLPKGGAVISVTVADRALGQPFKSLHEWVRRGYEGVADGQPTIRGFEMPNESTARNAVVSAFNSTALAIGEQPERRVTVFWEFRGKYFAAHLMYRLGDNNGPRFERVLFTVARSFRPLGIDSIHRKGVTGKE